MKCDELANTGLDPSVTAELMSPPEIATAIDPSVPEAELPAVSTLAQSVKTGVA